MTTSDKRPRRTTKSAKAKPDPKPVIDAASTAAPSLATAPAPGTPAKRARSPRSNPKPVETGRIKDVSITVTSRHREDRHSSIALAAYFRSESRGFAPGHEVEDWLAAEEEVDQRLLGEGRAS
jgi:hypothetical protein